MEKLLEDRWQNMHQIDECWLRFQSAQKTFDTAAEQRAEALKEVALHVTEGERLAALYDSTEVWITAHNDHQKKARSTTGTGGYAIAYPLPSAASPESSDASGLKRALYDGLPQRPAEKRLKTESGMPILTSLEEATEEVADEVAEEAAEKVDWEEVDEKVAQKIFFRLDKEASEEVDKAEFWKEIAEKVDKEIAKEGS